MVSLQEGIHKLQNDGNYSREAHRKLFGDNDFSHALDDWSRSSLGMQSYYQENKISENDQYWKDYAQMTGVSPRYPIRSGSNLNVATSSIPSTLTSFRPISKLYGGQGSGSNNE